MASQTHRDTNEDTRRQTDTRGTGEKRGLSVPDPDPFSTFISLHPHQLRQPIRRAEDPRAQNGGRERGREGE
eukprot:3940472-Rhodomonas_salina.5